jgi:uncharacterized protein YmfQ (DUF2313 family)
MPTDPLDLTADSTLWTADLEAPVADPVPSGWAAHSIGDYGSALLAMKPTGPAWPRDLDKALARFCQATGGIWGGRVEPRSADLLFVESDPRKTVELLPEWETAFGLPDPCAPEPGTVGERQAALVTQMTMIGGQSRNFFIGVGARIGYTITEIREWSPFMVGVSQVGDTRKTGTAGEQFRWEIGAPEMRFYWSIRVGATKLTWFRCGAGECGVDHHLEFATADDLECLFQRYKPAHTEVLFDYTGLTTPDPMAGTP